MEHFIDILSRLIIATITFVAPMIIFCFGVFNEAIVISKTDKKKKQEEIVERALAEMNSPDVDKVETFKNTNRKIKDKWHDKLASFILNPTFEIILIFTLLLISIGTLMFSHLVAGNIWKMYNYCLWKTLIHICFWSYLLSVAAIITFVTNIIAMKNRVERKKLI